MKRYAIINRLFFKDGCNLNVEKNKKEKAKKDD